MGGSSRVIPRTSGVWLALTTSVLLATTQPPAQDTTPTAQEQPAATESLPWPLKLGAKVQTVRRTVPTVDRVVLVNDAASFDAAVRQWSLDGRWPVLFEDDHYTPMFIRRFEPSEVLTLSVETPPSAFEGTDTRALGDHVRETAALTWWSIADRPDTASRDDLNVQWARNQWEPPGIVVTSMDDPAWPAAVALAAGWGQPLEFVRGSFGTSDGTLNTNGFARLDRLVKEAAANSGYAYDALGDAIDVVTLVHEMAPKYKPTDDAKEQLAITDGLCRTDDGAPWAVTGWIFGSRERATFMAMCSLFLDPPARTVLFNSYPTDAAAWSTYAMDEAATMLNDARVPTRHLQRPNAGVASWLRLGLVQADLMLVNTKGNATWFDLGDGRCFSYEVPTLHQPAAVHFIHSWSANMPGRETTIAGQWLDHGAFAYVGSVHEPYLQAFMPPSILTARLLSSAPFLVAARQFQSSKPWKITTIGDPLYTPFAPALRRVSIEDQPITSVPGDAVVIAPYRLRETPATALERKMESLLAARRAILALDAFTKASAPSARAIDLAWSAVHVAGDALAQREVRVMMTHVREPFVFVDAVRLSPHVRRTMGDEAMQSWLDSIEARTTDRYGRRMIKDAR